MDQVCFAPLSLHTCERMCVRPESPCASAFSACLDTENLHTATVHLLMAVTTVDHAKLDQISSEVNRRNSYNGKKNFLSSQLRKHLVRQPSQTGCEAMYGGGNMHAPWHTGKQQRFAMSKHSFQQQVSDSISRKKWSPKGWRAKQVSSDSLVANTDLKRAGVRRKSLPAGSLCFTSCGKTCGNGSSNDIITQSHGISNEHHDGVGGQSSKQLHGGRSPLGGAHQALSRFGSRLTSFEKITRTFGAQEQRSGSERELSSKSKMAGAHLSDDNDGRRVLCTSASKHECALSENLDAMSV